VSSAARDRIMSNLREAAGDGGEVPATACLPIATYGPQEKIDRLKTLMEAVKTEVHVVSKKDWPAVIKPVLRQRKLKTLLYAPETALGPELEKAWRSDSEGLPELVVYDGDIESFKETLFQTDAAITTTVGAIAETGAVVLWPDSTEPRLMSLVPPVHIAVVESATIYNSFCEIIQAQSWPEKMPTNVILISGPSKTADIEMTLAFGVHGPKELVIFILK
jgi:L-lactate dehydrogenase complex protein LldG